MTQFTTVTGRLVFGDPFKAVPVLGDDRKQKVGRDGVPETEYIVGVAFPKSDPGVLAMLAELRAADKAAWPQFHDAAGNLLPGVKFADKITDGDGYNTKGQSYAARDGWAGHWIIRFGSRFAPSCFRWGGSDWVPVTDPTSIKPGYYVRISGTTTSNQSAQSPGMYRNLNQVALVGFGPEIVRTDVDPSATFGSAPPVLPAGASATPVAPAAALPGAPVAAVAPPPVSAPVAPPPAPAAPVAPQRTMLPAAGGASYESFVAAGWTDETMRAAGYLA